MPISDSSPIPEIAEAAVKLAVAEAESLTLQVMEEEARILREEVERLKAEAAQALPASRPASTPAAGSSRRTRSAPATRGTRGTVSIREAVPQVLSGGQEMHTKDIATAVIATNGVSLQGETPEATVASFLATENKKGRTGLVRRVRPGVYKLRGRR